MDGCFSNLVIINENKIKFRMSSLIYPNHIATLKAQMCSNNNSRMEKLLPVMYSIK